jgi:hypothetical protein
MKTIFSVLFLSLLLPAGILAQDMQPPAPINNKVLEESIGNWISDEYEMMGMKWNEEMNVSWALNKQFIVVNSKSVSDKGMVYESVGYMTLDSDNNVKVYFFDNWGYEGISEFNGKMTGNVCTMEGGNKWMKSKGKMTFESGTMTNEINFTMRDLTEMK